MMNDWRFVEAIGECARICETDMHVYAPEYESADHRGSRPISRVHKTRFEMIALCRRKNGNHNRLSAVRYVWHTILSAVASDTDPFDRTVMRYNFSIFHICYIEISFLNHIYRSKTKLL